MKRFTLLLAFAFFQIIVFAQNGLVFTASNETTAVGSTACVKITTTNFTNIGSFQFSLTWDKNVATFLETKNFGLIWLAASNFNPNADGSGTVMIGSWNSLDGLGKSLPNGTVLLEICFTAVGASSTAITFSDIPNVREATDEKVNALSFSQQNGSITIGKDCPSLNLNIGDACNDQNPNTANDRVNQNCQCVGTTNPTNLNLTCPQNISDAAAVGQNSAIVNFTPPVGTSNCPTGAVVTSKIAGLDSGSAFPIGTSSVIYSAADACGNAKTCSFSITVTRTDPPPPSGCTNNLLLNPNFSNNFSNWWQYQAKIAGSKAEICNTDGGCGQAVGGTAGKTYRLSVMATLSNAQVNAQMTLKFLDAVGNELDVETSQFIYQNSPIPQILEAIAPAGTRFVQIHCWKSAGAGCLSVGDWCLTDDATSPPPPADCGLNLLGNANFSNGFASWWQYQAVAAANSGQVCSSDGGFGQTILAEVGANYAVWVKAALGAADARAVVGLKFMDADGKLLGNEIATLIKTTSLENYNLTGKTPAGAQFVQVWCWKSYGSGCVKTQDWCLSKTSGTNLTLPASLLTFNAHRRGNAVQLSWTNRTGALNDYFTAERAAADRQNWQPILKKNGSGAAGEILFFNELDHEPLAGENFYRLRWVLKDGSFSFSEVQKVVMPAPEELAIYPNPTNSEAWVNLKSYENLPVEVLFFNAMGSQFYQNSLQKVGNEPLLLDLQKFPAGIYWVKILTKTRSAQTLKLVVARN